MSGGCAPAPAAATGGGAVQAGWKTAKITPRNISWPISIAPQMIRSVVSRLAVCGDCGDMSTANSPARRGGASIRCPEVANNAARRDDAARHAIANPRTAAARALVYDHHYGTRPR